MIEVLIFYLHLIGVLYAFTKFWQKSGIKEGILSVLVIGLFFAIGWALTGTLARVLMPQSWNSIYFTSDTLSLVLLIIPEFVLFYHFFLRDSDKETLDKPAVK